MSSPADEINKFKNIFDAETLKTNMIFTSLFVAVFENMIDVIEENVESFLCANCELDTRGVLKLQKSEEFRKIILNRRVDDKGNKNSLKASMLWFVDANAISVEEYERFLFLKDLRDKYVHELTAVLFEGLPADDIELLFELLNLYEKLVKWWINEIEIPISGKYLPEEYDANGVTSLALEIFRIMVNVLYNDKSEEYMQTLSEFKSASSATGG